MKEGGDFHDGIDNQQVVAGEYWEVWPSEGSRLQKSVKSASADAFL